jgi:hypothetical protein
VLVPAHAQQPLGSARRAVCPAGRQSMDGRCVRPLGARRLEHFAAARSVSCEGEIQGSAGQRIVVHAVLRREVRRDPEEGDEDAGSEAGEGPRREGRHPPSIEG